MITVIEQANQQAAKHVYEAKVQPSTLIPKQVGNMYTASLYAAFASLLHNKNASLVRFSANTCFAYFPSVLNCIFAHMGCLSMCRWVKE